MTEEIRKRNEMIDLFKSALSRLYFYNTTLNSYLDTEVKDTLFYNGNSQISMTIFEDLKECYDYLYKQ